MSISRGLVVAILALWVCVAPAAAEWADWILDAEAGFESTDNLNNSSFAEDEESDSVWLSTIRGGRVLQVGDRRRLSLSGEVRGEIYDMFTLANAVEGGGRIAIVHKFGVGNKPWLRGSLYGGYKDVREDSWGGARFEAALDTGKRFSPRIDAAVGYSYTDRNGGEGLVADPAIPTNVFDMNYHRFTVSGNFLLARPLLLSAAVTLHSGDLVSACTPGNIGRVLARENLEALSLDPVFGGCIYRIDGDGLEGVLDLSYGFNDHLTLDLGYRYRSGEGSWWKYTTNAARLTLLYRY